MNRSAGRALALALACWVLCGVYTAPFVYRGWIAHDEGTLGQTADRVRLGEMPHRDFDDVYTGGLAYWHAAGMAAVGVDLRTMRLMLFGVFMLFLVAIYLIVTAIASPSAGLLAMALATVWSVPNYFAALPSWYNLFLATFSILAFSRFLIGHHRRWLFVAGLAGGVSILIKIVGVYCIAGGLLTLMYFEQLTAPPRNGGVRGTRWPVLLPGVSLAGAIGLIALVVGRGTLSSSFLPILSAPVLALAFLTWHELTLDTVRTGERIRRLTRLVVPFAAGTALPVAAWMAFYWWNDAWSDLVRGVWTLPQRRLTEAAMAPPPLAAIGLAAPYATLLLAGRRRTIRHQGLTTVVVAAILACALLFGTNDGVYRAVWAVIRALPLVVTLAAFVLLSGQPQHIDADDVAKRMRVFLVVVMMSTIGLVQIPYATPTYFCYVASLAIVAAFAVVWNTPWAPRRLHLTMAVFLLLFGVLFVNRSYGWNLGVKFIAYRPDGVLAVPRGGLRVPAADAETYQRIVALISEHSETGPIYAGPDSPEIYFLAGRHNPTRALFDVLGSETETPAWLARVVDTNGVRVAVINNAPLFSPPLTPEMQTVLQRRFPQAIDVGRFTVRFE